MKVLPIYNKLNNNSYNKIVVSVGKLGSNLWIGGHRYYGHWTWDGIHEGRIESVDWNRGEPNNHDGREDCLGTSRNNGAWNDFPCAALLPYICELQ